MQSGRSGWLLVLVMKGWAILSKAAWFSEVSDFGIRVVVSEYIKQSSSPRRRQNFFNHLASDVVVVKGLPRKMDE